MRHGVRGRKLSRSKNERRRLLQGLARELIARGNIKITLSKAKAVQPLIEKLVTRAKRGSTESLKRILSDWQSTKLLLSDAKSRFAARSSGFTRIVKLGTRAGDNAKEVLLQFVDPPYTPDPPVGEAGVKQLDTSGVKKPAPAKFKAKS